MANFLSTEYTAMTASPPTRIKVNKLAGRIRYAFSQFTNPAASGVGIGDIIYWTRIPRGGRVLGGLSRLNYGAGAASSTLNVGDTVSVARYMAATSITSANATTLTVAEGSGGIPYETTDESRDGATNLPTATNDCDLRSTAAGAAMQASQVAALHVSYVQD